MRMVATWVLGLAVLNLMTSAANGSPRLPRAADDPNDPAFDLEFPHDFIFSTATAAYQVEGAWNVSGKGESIWDRLSHEHPELILDGSNGDVACDSYHRFKEDIQMVKDLGAKMYRFSLSWSRLLPTGAIDVINQDGVQYYHALIDACRANGLEPMVTIFHWDLPQPLQDIGGLPNPKIVDYYVDYADFVFKTYGSKVKYWATFNEPMTSCAEGYGNAKQAPAIKSDGRGDYLCGHNILLAHGRAYRLYEADYKPTQNGQVGLSINTYGFWPLDPNNPEDVEAADRWQQFVFGWFAHPVFSSDGDYPPVMKKRVADASTNQGLKRSRLPEFTPDEIKMIQGSADFFGFNHYSSTVVAQLRATDPNQPKNGSREGDAGIITSVDPTWEVSIASWLRVVPEGFRNVLKWIKKEYNNPPVFVTENGYADLGGLKDTKRVRYYRLYLLELLKALHYDKCNIIGYTAWSLMDNYEWLYGYEHKFGLYHVDFTDPDRPRTPKMSAKFYEKLISSRKVPKDGDIVFPDDPTTPTGNAASYSRLDNIHIAAAVVVALLTNHVTYAG